MGHWVDLLDQCGSEIKMSTLPLLNFTAQSSQNNALRQLPAQAEASWSCGTVSGKVRCDDNEYNRDLIQIRPWNSWLYTCGVSNTCTLLLLYFESSDEYDNSSTRWQNSIFEGLLGVGWGLFNLSSGFVNPPHFYWPFWFSQKYIADPLVSPQIELCTMPMATKETYRQACSCKRCRRWRRDGEASQSFACPGTSGRRSWCRWADVCMGWWRRRTGRSRSEMTRKTKIRHFTGMAHMNHTSWNSRCKPYFLAHVNHTYWNGLYELDII